MLKRQNESRRRRAMSPAPAVFQPHVFHDELVIHAHPQFTVCPESFLNTAYPTVESLLI